MPAIGRLLALFVIIGAFGLVQVHAERAAGVDYDFVDRPANLPPDFHASTSTNLRFLAIEAIDGFRVDAALWQPKEKLAPATTLIVGMPGSGGNFANGTPSISPLLVAVGTRIAPRAPHRSRRALLTHRAYMRAAVKGYSGGV